MRRVRLVTAGALALAACITPPVQRDSELAVAERWSATLRPTIGFSVSGNAVVTQVSPRTARVSISLAGSTDGSLHPWDIHRGTCGDDGPVLGDPRSYVPIPIGGAGAATMQAEVPADLRQGRSYYINVHDSPMRERIVSCGALTHVQHGVVARRTP